MSSSEQDGQVRACIAHAEVFTQKAAGEPAASHPDEPASPRRRNRFSGLLLGSVFRSVGSVASGGSGVLGGVGSIFRRIGGSVGSADRAGSGSVASGGGRSVGSGTGSGSSSGSGVGSGGFTRRSGVGSGFGGFGGGFLSVGGRIGSLFFVASRQSEDALESPSS